MQRQALRLRLDAYHSNVSSDWMLIITISCCWLMEWPLHYQYGMPSQGEAAATGLSLFFLTPLGSFSRPVSQKSIISTLQLHHTMDGERGTNANVILRHHGSAIKWSVAEKFKSVTEKMPLLILLRWLLHGHVRVEIGLRYESALTNRSRAQILWKLRTLQHQWRDHYRGY